MSRFVSYLFVFLVVVALCVPSFPTVPAAADLPPLPPALLSPATPSLPQDRPLVDRGDGVRYVAGELLVRFSPEVGQALAVRGRAGSFVETGLPSLDRLAAEHGLQAIEPVFRRHTQELARATVSGRPLAPNLGDVYKLTFPAGADLERLVADYSSNPDVVYAEPDYAFEFDGTPDDPSFGQQWYLHNTGQYVLADADIDAPEAWDIITGTETIVIAVVDTGIDRDHPDLDEHIWFNPGETPGDGIDNDGNGYVDDVWGWNWVSDASDPDDYEPDDPRDDNGHGTHVAGIAAAETNNKPVPTGVAGVCWNCRVMALKAFESNGVGTTSDIVQAIDYAAGKGADVINMSFGSYAESLLLEDTLAAAYGAATLVAAAGNYGMNRALATKPYYPASYPYVLGVGATDAGCVERDPVTLDCLLVAEHRASFSNYGINADVGAPGVSILSTFRGDETASLSGTSMAAPIVSGLAALLLSQHPGWSKEMARAQMIKTADGIYTGAYPFTAVGSGRVNAYAALTTIGTPEIVLVGDSIVYDDDGDGDGIPDAGEMVDITLDLKNYWVEASATTAALSTSDPYVTIISDTASFGDVSAYATVRNTGSPFRFLLDGTAPNNHQVDVTLDISASGGAYTTSASFSFLVQRGIEIPHPLFPAVITEDMTLHSDYLYLVKQNMLVQQGVTLTIEPGARLQFDPDRFIKIEGTLIASGTEEMPITFTSNQKDPQPGDFKGIVFGDTATDAVLDGTPIITTAVKTGDPTPLAGEYLTFTTPAVMNEIGDVVFGATISGSTTGEGLFRWLRGHVLPIAAAGETAPDTGGASFAGFREAVVDNAGDLTFVADLSDDGQGVFAGNESTLTKIASTGDVVLNGTIPLTLTAFSYLTADGAGNAAFRATYWLTDSLVTKPGVFVYRMEQAKIYPTVGDIGWPFYEIEDVAAPYLTNEGSDAAYYLFFSVEGASSTGIQKMYYDEQQDEYHITSEEVYDGCTLESGEVMTFTTQDRVIPSPNGVWFTAQIGPAGRAIIDCGGKTHDTSCQNIGMRLGGDGDPAPDGRTLEFTGTIPYVFTGPEIVYNANLSSTTELDYGIVMSDAYSLVSLLEEGDALPDGGMVAAVANVSAMPHASHVGTVAAIVDVAGGASGEQRLLLIERGNDYTGGSVLNHVILEYGGGLYIHDAAPYIANSTFQNSNGMVPPGMTSRSGVVSIDYYPPSDPDWQNRQVMFVDNAVLHNTFLAVRLGCAAGARCMALRNLIHDNSCLDGSQNPGGVLVTSGGWGMNILRDNEISYNSSPGWMGGGILVNAEGSETLIFDNVIVRNQSTFDHLWYGGGGGIAVERGNPIIRGNVIANNRDVVGYTPGQSFGGGGSAIKLHSWAQGATIEYNTIVGNVASHPSRPQPGMAILGYGGFDFEHNNLLANESSYDMYLSNYNRPRSDADAWLTYWGTVVVNEIRYDRIYDYWQDFEAGEATFQPFLTAPEPLAPGFLWNATTFPPDPIGAETITVTLDFSRDMNTAITPTVTFGVDEPYTQHAVENGAWVSPTRWVGTYDVTVDTGDGINTLEVGGAEDADGMPIPQDTRFQFVIQTAGTSAVLLEAVAGVGQVALTWTQNDVTDLAGYILYRSAYTNTNYHQIGGGMFVTTAYTDTDVTNGVTYYYKYSVLDTDLDEAAWSNEVSLTPDDYTLPLTPDVFDDGATTHYFDRLHATWGSADPETGIAEYHYCIGTAAGVCDTVSWTSMGTQTETTKTGLSLVDGETYYVSVKARNGADHWSAVGVSDGIAVDRLPPPDITAVQPISGVRSVDVTLTLTGTGFATPTARLGTFALADLTLVSPTLMTATVPAYGLFAGVYTLTVTNFDTQAATLTRAYTATNPVQGPRPLLFSPASQQVGDDEVSTVVDVRVQDVDDLAAFQFDVVFDPAVLQVQDVTLGAFLGSGGRSTSPLGPTVDNTAGRVSFGAFSYGTGTGADGSGTLATITFAPQDTGTASLAFENAQLRDTLNSEIPANPQTGQVQVVHYPFGDFDRDCDVDVADIMVVASRWNTHTGDPDYDPAYDFDLDGDIDVADIMQVAVAWGDTCGTGLAAAPPATLALAAEGADLYFQPSSLSVVPGQPFTLTLAISGTEDLGGFQFDLLFDPEAIAVTGVHLGEFLQSTGNDVIALGPEASELGRLVYGAVSYGEQPGAGGSGRLVVLDLTMLAGGETTLSLEEVQLVASDATLAPLHWVGQGQIQAGAYIYLPLVVRQP